MIAAAAVPSEPPANPEHDASSSAQVSKVKENASNPRMSRGKGKPIDRKGKGKAEVDADVPMSDASSGATAA